MCKSGFQVELDKGIFFNHDLDISFFSFCTPELQAFVFSIEFKFLEMKW